MLPIPFVPMQAADLDIGHTAILVVGPARGAWPGSVATWLLVSI